MFLCLSQMLRHNKLECLSTISFSELSKFYIQSRAHYRVEHATVVLRLTLKNEIVLIKLTSDK
jgi:hypothetical protein